MSAEGYKIGRQVVKGISAEVRAKGRDNNLKRQEKFESADSLVLTAGVGHCFNPPTCELKEFDSRPR